MSTIGQGDRRGNEVEAVERRWILTVAVTFVVSVALLLGAHALYQATGPHPEVTLMLRKLKHSVTHADPRPNG